MLYAHKIPGPEVIWTNPLCLLKGLIIFDGTESRKIPSRGQIIINVCSSWCNKPKMGFLTRATAMNTQKLLITLGFAAVWISFLVSYSLKLVCASDWSIPPNAPVLDENELLFLNHSHSSLSPVIAFRLMKIYLTYWRSWKLKRHFTDKFLAVISTIIVRLQTILFLLITPLQNLSKSCFLRINCPPWMFCISVFFLTWCPSDCH